MSFDKSVTEYRAFVDTHGRLPTAEKTSSEVEKRLARWAAKQRNRSKNDKLTESQKATLEAIHGWRWDGQAEPAGIRKCGWGSGFNAQLEIQAAEGRRHISGPQRSTEEHAKQDYLRLKEAAERGEEEVFKVKGDLCDEAEDDRLQAFIRPIRERLGMSKDLPEGRAKREKWVLGELEVPGSEELLEALHSFERAKPRAQN